VQIGNDHEVLFNPPLESLIQQSIADPSKEVTVEPAKTDIDQNLLASVLNFIEQMEPPVEMGGRIPFSGLANYLHNQFEGDFCKRFGYIKPKELAIALEKNGLVKISAKPPLYLELTEKMVIELHRFAQGLNETEGPVDNEPVEKGNDVEVVIEVLLLLEKEGHYPTDEKIGIKLRTLHPKMNIDLEPLLLKALNAKALVKEKRKNRTLYWPADRKWNAIDPDDTDDPYSEQMWTDFRQAVHRLHSAQKTAQTRYHLARNLGNLKGRAISELNQAQREHMVQLAVNKKILETTHTGKGLRISVPDTMPVN
jgi:hypothetical protein